MIKYITYEEIYNIWRNDLWPDRSSKIASNSAMCFLEGHDMANLDTSPSFFGYYIDNRLAGVNSGHLCSDNSYRSRGLYVFEDCRGMGIGIKLLQATIEQAKIENASFCWSYPRLTSWKTYEAAGFTLSSDWDSSETSDANAFCKIDLITSVQ